MKQPAGFSLLELIIALALATIISGFAVPAVTDWINSAHSLIVTQKLANVISHARAAAITKNRHVIICGTSNDSTCNNLWPNPLIVFVDHDGDAVLDPDDLLLSKVDITPQGGTLHWRAFGGSLYIKFRPSGQTSGGNGRMTYCHRGGDARYAQQLIIARTGRIRRATDSNGDGIREGRDGENLSCP